MSDPIAYDKVVAAALEPPRAVLAFLQQRALTRRGRATVRQRGQAGNQVAAPWARRQARPAAMAARSLARVARAGLTS